MTKFLMVLNEHTGIPMANLIEVAKTFDHADMSLDSDME